MRYIITDVEVWISKEGRRGKFMVNGRRFHQRVKQGEKEEAEKELLNNARLTIFREKTGQDPYTLSPEAFKDFLFEYRAFPI